MSELIGSFTNASGIEILVQRGPDGKISTKFEDTGQITQHDMSDEECIRYLLHLLHSAHHQIRKLRDK